MKKSSKRLSLDETKNGSFNLMKHTGKFVPHKGASLEANFKIQKVHAKKNKDLKLERVKNQRFWWTLYWWESRDTVRIKYATVQDARDTVRKVKNVNKPFARKIQILTVLEQRAKVAGKNQQAAIAKRGKEAIRRKHKKKWKIFYYGYMKVGN